MIRSATPRLDQLEDDFGPDARLAGEVYGENLHILSFQENQRGGDPVAHTYDGKAVFPDKFRGGDQVQVGEPWLCEVNSKGGSTFFAAPLARLDASFFLDILRTQREELARIAVDTRPDLILEAMQGAGIEVPTTQDDTLVSELVTTNGDLTSKLRDLEEQYEDLQARLRHAEHELRTHVENAPTATDDSEPEPQRATGAFTPIGGVQSGPVQVTRTQEDVLQSPDFTASAYYGHLSPDRRRLFLKPHPKGNLPCVKGRVHVPGMNRFAPFEDVMSLSGHYDPRHGGFFVKIA